eukprot:g2773.t1
MRSNVPKLHLPVASSERSGERNEIRRSVSARRPVTSIAAKIAALKERDLNTARGSKPKTPKGVKPSSFRGRQAFGVRTGGDKPAGATLSDQLRQKSDEVVRLRAALRRERKRDEETSSQPEVESVAEESPDLQLEIHELSKKLEKLERENGHLRQSFAKVVTKNDALKEEMKAQKKKHCSDIENLRKTVTQRSKAGDVAKSAAKDVSEKLRIAMKECADAKSTAAAACKKQATLEEEILVSREQVTTLSKSLQELKQAYTLSEDKAKHAGESERKHRKEAEELRTKVRAQKKLVTSLRESSAVQKVRIKELERRMLVEVASVQKEKAREVELEKEIATLQLQLKRFQARKATLASDVEGKLRDAEQRASALASDLAEARKACDELRPLASQLKASKGIVDKQSRALDRANASVKQLREELAQSKAAAADAAAAHAKASGELEAKLAEGSARQGALKAEIDASHELVRSLRAQIEDSKQQAAAEQSMLEGMRARVKALEQEAKGLRPLRQQLESSRQVVESLRRNQEREKAAHDVGLKMLREELSRDLDAERRKCAKLAKEAGSLRAELESLRKAAAEKGSELDALRKNSMAKSSELKALEQRHSSDLSSLRLKIAALEDKNAALSGKVKDTNAEIKRLRELVAEMEAQKSLAESEGSDALRRAEKARKEALGKVQEKEVEAQSLRKKLEGASKRWEACKDELAKARRENQSLKEARGKSQGDNASLKERLRMLEARIATLEGQLAEAKRSKADVELKLSSAKAEIEKLRAKLKDADKSLSDLRRVLKGKASLSAQLKASEAGRQELSEKLGAMEKDLERARGSADDVVARARKKWRAEKEALLKRIADLESDTAAMASGADAAKKLGKEIAIHRATIKDHVQRLKKLREEGKKKDARIAELSELVATRDEKISKQHDQIKRLKRVLSAAEAKVKNGLEKASQESEASGAERAALKAGVKKFEKLVASLVKGVEEEAKAKGALSNLNMLIKTGETSQASKKCDNLRKEIANYKQTVSLLQYHVNYGEKQVAKFDVKAAKKQTIARKEAVAKLEEAFAKEKAKADRYQETSKNNVKELSEMLPNAKTRLIEATANRKKLVLAINKASKALSAQ